MARDILGALAIAALGCSLLSGCSQSSSVGAEHHRSEIGDVVRVAKPDPRAVQRKSPDVADVAADPRAAGDVPPWLDELLHDSDPHVRVQGLDAWAQQPGRPLDVVTTALVDPDESVRARAQELLERELVRR